MRRLRIAPQHMQQMAAHVAVCSPLEACGLVAADGGESVRVFLIENELASPTHYSLQPRQQLEAFMEIERRGWRLLAIFHSHPNGPPHPSQTDLAEARYPGVAHLIWAPDAAGGWACRAFMLDDGQVAELELAM